MNDLSIYIHVPYCTGKCGYCDFHSEKANSTDEIETYVRALALHLKLKSTLFRERSVKTVYFGGGTPSAIGTDNLVGLLNDVKENYNVCDDAEITVEANPGDICIKPLDTNCDKKMALKRLRENGFNRISLGVQSSSDEELHMLSRRHNFNTAQESVKNAREAGFDNITLDLMYGLPNQTMQSWQKSLEDITQLMPEHISCYALKLDENVPLFAISDKMPDDDGTYSLYRAAVDFLTEKGYHQYEISNFARIGRESRHNSGYWTGGDYLSFGPSAHSYISPIRYAYESNTKNYVEAVMNHTEPHYSEHSVLTVRDKIEEYVMLRLRMSQGLDLNELSDKFLINTGAAEAKLRKFQELGLCSSFSRVWRLTPDGMFVSNAIIVDIFDCLGL